MECSSPYSRLGDLILAYHYYHRHLKQLGISDSQKVIMALQDEIRRSKDARYHHRPGRPPRLNDRQPAEVADALHSSPENHGLGGNSWDEKTLSPSMITKYGVKLDVRRCQRLFYQLGFRYRKPRPLIAGTDPNLKEAQGIYIFSRHDTNNRYI
jgi:transposase